LARDFDERGRELDRDYVTACVDSICPVESCSQDDPDRKRHGAHGKQDCASLSVAPRDVNPHVLFPAIRYAIRHVILYVFDELLGARSIDQPVNKLAQTAQGE
jgi:hypothetical protein